MKVLFVNHGTKACGIHQIGKRIAGFLIPSSRFNVIYAEIASAEEMMAAIQAHQPKIIVYNYYPATLPWMSAMLTYAIRQFGPIQCGIVHDLMDPVSILSMEAIFDYWMIHDQTNPIVSYRKFTTCRPIPRFPAAPPLEKLSFGTHGFGISPWKSFDQIVTAIDREFDEAVINMNIGLAGFGDPDGAKAVEWRELCYSRVTKPGIQLNITHDFLETEEEMIGFLQKNTANLYFVRDPKSLTGPAGSADLAIAARRGLVVNTGYMYRHISTRLGAYGPNGTLKQLCENQVQVEALYNEWSPEHVRMDYENMFERALSWR